ncbi:MAG: hypothetical protein JSW07_10995, partial [bacterium]
LRKYDCLAIWYSVYGNVLYYLGKFNDALISYDKGEILARKVNDEALLIKLKLNKGDLYCHLKQNSLARKLYQETYNLAKSKKLKELQHRANVRLANLMFDKGEYTKARLAYQEFIDFMNQEPDLIPHSYWSWKLAKTYKLEGHYELAKKEYLRAYKTALNADSKYYMAWCLLGLAELEVIEGNVSEVFKLYDKVLEIATKEKDIELLSEVHRSKGNTYKKMNDLNRAITAYIRATDIIEQARQNLKVEQFRIGYFSGECEVYQNLVHCLLKRYEMNGDREDLDSIYYYDQMERYRTLQELRLRKESPIKNNANKGVFNEYLKAAEQLRIMQRRLRQQVGKYCTTKEWNHLISQLEVARYSLIAQRLRLIEDDQAACQIERSLICPLSTIVENLKHQELGLLTYHISEETSFVMVTTADGVQIVRLQVSPNSLTTSIDSLIYPLHNV